MELPTTLIAGVFADTVVENKNTAQSKKGGKRKRNIRQKNNAGRPTNTKEKRVSKKERD